MTREEAQSCIKTIELLRRLAYNIHGVMDVIDARNCEKIIEALSREPSEDVKCSEISNSSDCINRHAAIEALAGMIDRFEKILAAIRESKGDDSVCGMCEYDGAYMGQSGDWCNECPGFDKDDCFKLSDECRKRWMGDIVLPSAAPSLKIMVDEQPTVELAAERETTTVTIGKTRGGRTVWYECDNCGAPVHPEDRYCSECGRRLKVPSGDMHENLSYREK